MKINDCEGRQGRPQKLMGKEKFGTEIASTWVVE
jgi:hypothetical protein